MSTTFDGVPTFEAVREAIDKVRRRMDTGRLWAKSSYENAFAHHLSDVFQERGLFGGPRVEVEVAKAITDEEIGEIVNTARVEEYSCSAVFRLLLARGFLRRVETEAKTEPVAPPPHPTVDALEFHLREIGTPQWNEALYVVNPDDGDVETAIFAKGSMFLNPPPQRRPFSCVYGTRPVSASEADAWLRAHGVEQGLDALELWRAALWQYVPDRPRVAGLPVSNPIRIAQDDSGEIRRLLNEILSRLDQIKP